MSNYTERLELPEGQWALFTTRLDAAGYQAIRVAAAREQDLRRKPLTGADPILMVALRDAFLLECWVKNPKTDQFTADVNHAHPTIAEAIELKAASLWIAWRAEAEPGPKGSSPTESQTPSGEKTDAPSATSEPS